MSEAAFSVSFSNFKKCRPEVAGDVIFGAALAYVGVDVRAKLGDSRLNRGRIIRLWPTGPVLRTCVQNLLTFYSRPETVIVTSYPAGLWGRESQISL